MFGCLPTFAVNASSGPIDVGAPSTPAPKYFRDGVSRGRTSYGSAGAADGFVEGAGGPGAVPATAGAVSGAGCVVHPTTPTRRPRSQAHNRAPEGRERPTVTAADRDVVLTGLRRCPVGPGCARRSGRRTARRPGSGRSPMAPWSTFATVRHRR